MHLVGAEADPITDALNSPNSDVSPYSGVDGPTPSLVLSVKVPTRQVARERFTANLTPSSSPDVESPRKTKTHGRVYISPHMHTRDQNPRSPSCAMLHGDSKQPQKNAKRNEDHTHTHLVVNAVHSLLLLQPYILDTYLIYMGYGSWLCS